MAALDRCGAPGLEVVALGLRVCPERRAPGLRLWVCRPTTDVIEIANAARADPARAVWTALNLDREIWVSRLTPHLSHLSVHLGPGSAATDWEMCNRLERVVRALIALGGTQPVPLPAPRTWTPALARVRRGGPRSPDEEAADSGREY